MQTTTKKVELRALYIKNYLRSLNKEFRKCTFDCEILNLSFINSKINCR